MGAVHVPAVEGVVVDDGGQGGDGQESVGVGVAQDGGPGDETVVAQVVGIVAVDEARAHSAVVHLGNLPALVLVAAAW